jgi:hypothetical protein
VVQPIPAEREAIATQTEADRVAAVARLTASPVPRAPVEQPKVGTRQMTPTPVAGIRDVQMSPFSSQEALVENQWQEVVSGELVVVYAGRLTQTPDQGFVAVQMGTRSSKTFSLQRYLTPAQAGAVKIVDVNGLQLTLRAADGTTFAFDVPSRTFVSSR